MPSVAALRTLYAYAADPANENPAACEAIELEEQISERERALVVLRSPTHPPFRPAAAFHCNSPDPRTTQCDGVVADGTAQPDARRLSRPPSAERVVVRLVSRLQGARLIGLYRTSLFDVVRGRPVVRIDAAQPIRIGGQPGGVVIIALYGAPAPYKVRKLVWYY